jgi:DNA-binding response OmpR family regulator
MDDKPAIATQIQEAIADTAWKVHATEDVATAVNFCVEHSIDIVLASLSLPKDGAYLLYQNLRGFSKTSPVPILGLCVKTATTERTRAQQTGFAACVTKPIEPAEVKAKICRILKLETAYKYYTQRESVLALKIPKKFDEGVSDEISANMNGQLTATVEAGNDKLVLDLTEVESLSLRIIELIVSTMEACSKLSLNCAVVGSDKVKGECRNYTESQTWLFAGTFEEAVSKLKESRLQEAKS